MLPRWNKRTKQKKKHIFDSKKFYKTNKKKKYRTAIQYTHVTGFIILLHYSSHYRILMESSDSNRHYPHSRVISHFFFFFPSSFDNFSPHNNLMHFFLKKWKFFYTISSVYDSDTLAPIHNRAHARWPLEVDRLISGVRKLLLRAMCAVFLCLCLFKCPKDKLRR